MFLRSLRKANPRVVVSYRDAGFGDNLLAAANAWRYARDTGRDLAIVWAPSRYVADKSVNAFAQLFDLPESLEGVRIHVPPRVDSLSRRRIAYPEDYVLLYFPHPYQSCLYYAHRFCLHAPYLWRMSDRLSDRYRQCRSRRRLDIEERIRSGAVVGRATVVANGCFGPTPALKPFFDALRPKPPAQALIDAFARQHFAGKRVIAAHVRYYDKKMLASNHTRYWIDAEEALRECVRRIRRAVSKIEGDEHVIFLATDSNWVHQRLSSQFASVVTYGKTFGTDSTRELHVQLPVETAQATIVEMFLLAQSHVLVRYPGDSWFSYYASLYAGAVIGDE
ncbi:MAG: nodulation protein NodZ [Phycisphaeraceae bacterium]